MEIRELQEAELEEVVSMQCQAFGRPTGQERYRQYVRGDASFRWDQARVAVVDGKIVAHLRIWDRKLRVGKTAVPCGGIGSVCTKPEQKGKGYASTLVRQGHDEMRALGYEVALLFSDIPFRFYRRIGYECVPRPGFTLEEMAPRQAEPELDWEVEEFDEPRDLEQVIALHRDCNAEQSGTIVRSQQYWEAVPSRIRGLLPTLVARRNGRVRGYLNHLTEGDTLSLREVAYDKEERSGLAAMGHHLLSLSERSGAKRISGYVPHRHPFVDKLARLSQANLSVFSSGKMMLFAVDLSAMLERLRPALQERIDRSQPDISADVEVVVQANGQECALRLDGGRLEVRPGGSTEALNLPPDLFWRLLMGESTVAQLKPVLSSRGAKLDDEITEFIGALFPATGMLYWESDFF